MTESGSILKVVAHRAPGRQRTQPKQDRDSARELPNIGCCGGPGYSPCLRVAPSMEYRDIQRREKNQRHLDAECRTLIAFHRLGAKQNYATDGHGGEPRASPGEQPFHEILYRRS